jgi:hypothetical protein
MLIGSSADEVLKIQSLKEDKLMRGFDEEKKLHKGESYHITNNFFISFEILTTKHIYSEERSQNEPVHWPLRSFTAIYESACSKSNEIT